MKFSIFATTSAIFLSSSSPFASVANAQRPPVNGYDQGLGLKSDGFCDGKTEVATDIDLFNSVVTESTLHKSGGKLVFDNVGVVRNRPVNLVVKVYDGEYTTSKPQKNGKPLESMFGNINMMTKKNDIHSGEGNFEMCFRDKETDELVTVDSFMWSVYDIDERNAANNGIKEKFIFDTKQAQEYVLWPNTEESEVKMFCENFQLWPHTSASQVNQLPCNEGERIIFHSSTNGVGADNPTDKDEMTDLQKSRSIQFAFVNTSCWRFTYNHYCPPDEAGASKDCLWYGGGNFLFAGSAKQLIEEGECITESPTQSPTDVPTTASPTKNPTMSPTKSPTAAPTQSPTASPTATPTQSPTKVPTAKPTKSPTVAPTKDPTKAPTASPTASPTKSPTDAPTSAPTKIPTKSPTKSPTTSPTASSTQPPIGKVCAADVKQCADGSFVSRDPTNDCQFKACPPTASPTLSPTVIKTRPPINTNGEDGDDDFVFEPGCEKDLELVSKQGHTNIDLNRVVKIISQDSSTVKVSLNQGWDQLGDEDIPIDHIFYSFRPDTFDDKCYEETNIREGTIFDTVTISCNVLTPYAKLEICLVDDLQNELLTVEDDAMVPKCCHPTFPPNTPTVCYTIKINCVTECVDDDDDDDDEDATAADNNGIADFIRRGLRGYN